MIILYLDGQPTDSLALLRKRLENAEPAERTAIGRDMLHKEDQLRSWLTGEPRDNENPLFELLKRAEDRRPAAEIVAEFCGVSAEELGGAAEESGEGQQSTVPGLENVPRNRIAVSTQELEKCLNGRTENNVLTLYLAGKLFLLRPTEKLRGVCLIGYGKSKPAVYVHPSFRGKELDPQALGLTLENVELHPQGCLLRNAAGSRLKDCFIVDETGAFAGEKGRKQS